MRMAGRFWRWVGGGLLLGLLPFGVAYFLRYYHLGRTPALRDLLGAGQGLLVSVGWAGTALREGATAPPSRRGQRDFVVLASTLLLVAGTMIYGFRTAEIVAGQPPTVRQEETMTRASLGLLGLAAIVSAYAVALGTPNASEGDT